VVSVGPLESTVRATLQKVLISVKNIINRPCPLAQAAHSGTGTCLEAAYPIAKRFISMNEDSKQSQSHIDSIVRQEEEALERRSSSERLADAVGVFAGSLFFIVLHLVLVIAWLVVNSGEIPGIRPFDPHPFSLLGVIVAVEAVILSSFILMRQNRMMRRGERRDHLNLQVDLLAEKEITKVLQMVRAICGHMGLQNIMADTEIHELSQTTSIESLSQTLEDRLPGT
jgi:uncharacterized membrane protein